MRDEKVGKIEVARIPKRENDRKARQRGIEPRLAPLFPGVDYLMENHGIIHGHIEKNGDVVIDQHIKPKKPKGN